MGKEAIDGRQRGHKRFQICCRKKNRYTVGSYLFITHHDRPNSQSRTRRTGRRNSKIQKGPYGASLMNREEILEIPGHCVRTDGYRGRSCHMGALVACFMSGRRHWRKRRGHDSKGRGSRDKLTYRTTAPAGAGHLVRQGWKIGISYFARLDSHA